MASDALEYAHLDFIELGRLRDISRVVNTLFSEALLDALVQVGNEVERVVTRHHMTHAMRLKFARAGFVAVRSGLDAWWDAVFDDVDELARETTDFLDSLGKKFCCVVDS